jgi:transposase
MSDTFSRVEIIPGVARRRWITSEQKLAVVAVTVQPGQSIRYFPRYHRLSPRLVFRWKRLMKSDGHTTTAFRFAS